MNILVVEEMEYLKENLNNGLISGYQYLDTLDFEDDYSHNEIEEAREDFIESANEYLLQNDYPYVMRESCENAMLCSKDTDEIVR